MPVPRALDEIHRFLKVFLAIAENEGCTEVALVRVTGYSTASVRGMLRILAAMEWIEIEHVKEVPRRVSIRLTEKGRRFIEFAKAMLEDVEKAIARLS